MARRWLIRVFVFLLLGAAVNVGVAWVCVLTQTSDIETCRLAGFSAPAEPTRRITADELNWLELHGWSQTGILEFSLVEKRGIGLRQRAVLQAPRDIPMNASITYFGGPLMLDTQAGWPLTSLSDRARGLLFQSIDDPRPFDHADALYPPEMYGLLPASECYAVPTRARSPGFAVNTLFYAVILWLLICGPFAARRLIRIKRGRCVKCGYDLRGGEHEQCPECGAVVKMKEAKAEPA